MKTSFNKTWPFGAVLAVVVVLATMCMSLGFPGALVAQEYVEQEVTNGGTITGRIAFAGKDYPKPEKVRTTRDADTCGISKMTEEFVVDAETGGLKNVVVRLIGIDKGKKFPEVRIPVVLQKGCTYEPHVSLVFGKKYVFIENSDPVLHNVHAFREDKTTAFNVAQPIQGQRNRLKIRGGAGVYSLKCDVHAWMSAWIVIVDHPYATITDELGHFSLDGVPPGDYEVLIWHEGIGEGSKKVHVDAGESSEVEFVIGEN